MSKSAPFSLNRNGVLLALISAAFAGEAGAAAGRVEFTAGGVTVSGTDGRERPLARGTELDNGDTVRTTDGRAQIRFTDGAFVSLQPNTEFAIKDYRFEGRTDGKESGIFALAKGAMRTVTGAIGRVNRNRYQITTPTATVGIRGTGGVIQILNDGSTLVVGTSGIWSLTNPAGSIDVPAGVSGLAPSTPDSPPQQTSQAPQSGPAPIPEKPLFSQGDEKDPTGGPVGLGISTFKPLLSGSGYAPAIALSITAFEGLVHVGGGDGGEGGPQTATAVFNPAGQLTELDFEGTVYKLGPGGTHADFGSDGILAWGRWIGQVTNQGGEENYTANQGFHYVIGMPTPVMPTGGTATYGLLGATNPTYRDASTSPGKFSGSLTVNFGATHTIDGNFKVAMPDTIYSWTDRATTPSAFFSMSTNSVTGCSACTCNASVRGFFSGASAERAGISYHVRDSLARKDAIGAAAFKKQ